MSISAAMPAQHIHLTSQSTLQSCSEKCFDKWQKGQAEELVPYKHERIGKKKGEEEK